MYTTNGGTGTLTSLLSSVLDFSSLGLQCNVLDFSSLGLQCKDPTERARSLSSIEGLCEK